MSIIHKLYQSTIDVKNRPEYCEKKIPSALKTIKTRIDRKNTPIPLLNNICKKYNNIDKIIIGNNVTNIRNYYSNNACKVKEFELKITPAIVEKIITNKRFTSINTL